MRQVTTSTPHLIRFGVFEVDLQAEELRKNGSKIKLEGQPFEILALLLERPGQLVARDKLKQKLWPADTFVDFEHSINAAVKRLREALDDSADTPRYIETLPPRGYRFIYPVDGAAAEVRQPAAWWRRRWVAGALGVIGVTAGLLAGNVGGLRDRLLGRPVAREIAAIAVLPLRNLSGDPEQDYFAEGMTEALITELGKISALQVISHQSVMRYRRTAKPLPEIARELKADALIEGTVLRSGDRVRITANLVQAVPERHLWAESYELDRQDIMAAQGEVARAISHELRIKLTPQEQVRLAGTRHVNPEAYEAYLMGRHHFNRDTADGRIRAKEYFEKAIEKDPSFARAYASLAELWVRGGSPLVRRTLEGRVNARQWAAKALELDDTLAEAHTALGFAELSDWDWADAEREFRRAVELNPSYALARIWYAWYLEAMQRSEEALDQAKLAQQLDPVSPYINFRAGYLYFSVGRLEEARASWRKVLEVEPSSISAHVALAQAYIIEGMYPQAIAELEGRIASGERDVFAVGTLACAYGLAGRREEALKIAKELERRSERENVPPGPIAYAYVGLADKDMAFAWLEKIYKERRWIFTLSGNRMFDPLRDDPRFQELLRRVGLPSAKAK